MDYVMWGSVGLGVVAGIGFRRLTNAIAVAALVGLGVAITYHVWLNADPSRDDAQAALGYLFAFIYPMGACLLAWGARDLSRKSD